MGKVGAPVQAASLFRLEKGNRRVTVDELVGFAEVFGVAVEKLLLPPEVAESKTIRNLVTGWERARSARISAQKREDGVWELLCEHLTERLQNPEAAENEMGFWLENVEPASEALAWLQEQIPGDPEWLQRLAARFGEG